MSSALDKQATVHAHSGFVMLGTQLPGPGSKPLLYLPLCWTKPSSSSSFFFAKTGNGEKQRKTERERERDDRKGQRRMRGGSYYHLLLDPKKVLLFGGTAADPSRQEAFEIELVVGRQSCRRLLVGGCAAHLAQGSHRKRVIYNSEDLDNW